MLTKITAVDLTSKEAKYHDVCRVRYQSEAESALEVRKASLTVAFSHSHSLWHKERKAHAEAFNALKIYIEDRILEKKEVHLLFDINSYYLALLQDTVDTDLKHITSSAQKLEAKILKCYPEKIKIEKGKTRRGNIALSSSLSTEETCRNQYSKVTSDDMQIRDVAFKLRQEIMNASSIKLPEHLKVEDIFKGEVEVPDLVQNFFKYLIGGPDSRKWDLESRKRRIKSISQDIVFSTTSGIKNLSKHSQIGLAIKSLTGSRKVVKILNRMGNCVSYSTVEELETELSFEANKNNKETPFEMKTTPEFKTGIACDNFDRFVEIKSGKDILHDTVGNAYRMQDIPMTNLTAMH